MRRKRRGFIAIDAFIGAFLLGMAALLYFAVWRNLDYAVAYSDALREARLSCETELARLRAEGVRLSAGMEPIVSTRGDGAGTITTTLSAGTGPWSGMVLANVAATRPIADRAVAVHLVAFLIVEESR